MADLATVAERSSLPTLYGGQTVARCSSHPLAAWAEPAHSCSLCNACLPRRLTVGTGVRHKTRGHGRVTAFDEASHHPYEVTFDNGEVRCRRRPHTRLRGGSALDCKP